MGDWIQIPLHEMALINPREKIAKDSSTPFIDMAALRSNSRSHEEPVKRDAPAGSRFRDGDTVLARITPCLENGKTAQVSGLGSGVVGAGSTEFIVLRGREGLSASDFVYYLCRLPRFRDFAIAQMTGTSGRQRVQIDSLGEFVVDLPPIAEQRAIAEVLGALDDKIESNRRIWQTSLELISVARSYLTSAEIVSTTSLGQLVDFNVNTEKPGPDRESIIYVDIASVSPGSIEKRQVLDWGSAPSRARRGVGDGDVIFSTVRPGRRSFAPILDPDPRMVVSTGFAVMTPRHCGTSFLLAVVLDTNFSDYCETVAQGSAYPAVSPASMSRYEVEVPSVDVLARFDSTYLPIIRRGDRAQSESVILSALRDSLLPELLSGRLRVADAQKVVEEAV